jgi:MFS family permease
MVGLRTTGRGSREAEETRIGYRMLGLGFQVVSEVGAGLLGGWLLQWATGWRWGVVVGGAAGILVGLYTLIRSAWKLNAGLEASERRGKAQARGSGEVPR